MTHLNLGQGIMDSNEPDSYPQVALQESLGNLVGNTLVFTHMFGCASTSKLGEHLLSVRSCQSPLRRTFPNHLSVTCSGPTSSTCASGVDVPEILTHKVPERYPFCDYLGETIKAFLMFTCVRGLFIKPNLTLCRLCKGMSRNFHT